MLVWYGGPHLWPNQRLAIGLTEGLDFVSVVGVCWLKFSHLVAQNMIGVWLIVHYSKILDIVNCRDEILCFPSYQMVVCFTPQKTDKTPFRSEFYNSMR